MLYWTCLEEEEIEEYQGSENKYSKLDKMWLRLLVKPRRLYYKAEPEVNKATAITMVVQGYET